MKTSRGPLAGKRILVTRSQHQAFRTCRLLEDAGARVVLLPTIKIAPPKNPDALMNALRDLPKYKWLIFTSANGVTAFRTTLFSQGLDSRAMAQLRICAIGPGTAEALEEIGILPDLVPDNHIAEGILTELTKEKIHGQHILIPRAAIARDVLPDQLRKNGAIVDVVEAYETVLPDPDEMEPGLTDFRAGNVDVVTFTSASTVNNLFSIVGSDLVRLCANKVVAVIGPITSKACLERGLKVDVMPHKYTLPDLVDALADYFLK